MSSARAPGRFGLRVPVDEERAVELSYSVLDTAPVGMAVTDGPSAVAWANEALLRMCGHTHDELRHGSLAAVVDSQDWEEDERMAARVIAGESSGYEIEQRWRHRDGRTIWVAVTASLATDPSGDPLIFAGSGEPALVRQVVDVTARHDAEEAAAAALAELERRNAELERSNEELAEFSYAVSHDLSEPLRVIAGHVQLLAQRYRGRLEPEADTWIEFAVEGCARMRALIDELLAYSRVGRGERPVGPVDLSVVVQHALDDVGAAVDESGAELRVGPLPVVEGDEIELRRVVANLIANAVKFRRPDVAPAVRVDARRHGDAWRIEVADNGIGIPERHRERVFKPFQRLHLRDAYEGTGMGLTIVRKAVLRMGGEVGIDTSSSGGTTVWFTVPDDRGVPAS